MSSDGAEWRTKSLAGDEHGSPADHKLKVLKTALAARFHLHSKPRCLLDAANCPIYAAAENPGQRSDAKCATLIRRNGLGRTCTGYAEEGTA